MAKKKSVDVLLDEIYANATAKFQTSEPYDLWIIDGSFICEPYLGGMQLGRIYQEEIIWNDTLLDKFKYDLNKKKILNITQQELDSLMDAYYEENECYPDS
jgi:HD superfamily phosphodiesterase